MDFLDPSAPPVVDARKAIRRGDVAALEARVAALPALATARIGDPDTSGTLLHDLADSPGHVPDGPASLRILLAGGADVDAHCAGGHQETPLHYAASNDDMELVDALVARATEHCRVPARPSVPRSTTFQSGRSRRRSGRLPAGITFICCRGFHPEAPSCPTRSSDANWSQL
jgi:ankyrin repeat protein